MGYIYTKATRDDIAFLTKTRIWVLRAANRLSEAADMSLVEQESRHYDEAALASGEHTAYLVFDKKRFIGAGGISFYRVMPTYDNPTGRKAYNHEYVHRARMPRMGHCKQGTSFAGLRSEAAQRFLHSLEATAMGKPVYEKYGFIKVEHDYKLPEPSE